MCSIGGSMNILATVLIFKLSCDSFHFPGVNLSRKRNKWESVVRHYRSGKRYDISENLKKELREAKYIMGKINTKRVPQNPRNV